MGTPNSGQPPSFGGASGAPGGGIMDTITGALNKFGIPTSAGSNPMQAKMAKMGGANSPNKWGLPSLAGVPTAAGTPGSGFNAGMDPGAKQALLAQMIARARGGGAAPTGTVTPAPGAGANGGAPAPAGLVVK